MSTLTRTEVEVRASHLRAFTLPSYAGVRRVALVPEQAVLLAGDHVMVRVRVGAGRSLEIVEPGGTVAYEMRGGCARWDVTVEMEAGSRLVWRGEPFIIAEGADVPRRTTVDIAAGARLAMRETLVLGRAGERAQGLLTRTEIHRDGVPVLIEEVDASVGFGGHRVLDQVTHLGSACTAEGMTMESGDLLHRWLGSSLHHSRLSCPEVVPTP